MIYTDRRAFLKRAGAAGLLPFLSLKALAAPPEHKNKKAKNKDLLHGSSRDDVSGLLTAGITVSVARDLFRGAGGFPGPTSPSLLETGRASPGGNLSRPGSPRQGCPVATSANCLTTPGMSGLGLGWIYC